MTRRLQENILVAILIELSIHAEPLPLLLQIDDKTLDQTKTTGHRDIG
jgi:hypothetical protein